jgi:ubiquitin carboxyl-terminal hydrolase 10
VTPSETVQPFTMQQLDIQSDGVHSVEDALRLLTAPEKASGYRAKGCATEVDAMKTVQLSTCHRYLTSICVTCDARVCSSKCDK